MPHADPEARAAYMRAYRAQHPESAEYRRARRHRKVDRLRGIILAAKEQPCADCGVQYPYHVMEFDHCHGDKEFEINSAVNTTKGVAALEREIAKCEVVCANCHRLRHPPQRIR